jgi:hypothetical protein
MGGNVFENTVRLTAKQYDSLKQCIQGVCWKYNAGMDVIQSYKSKESHGDMDILLMQCDLSDDDIFELLNGAANLLGFTMSDTNKVNHKNTYEKYVKNGDITSYAMKTTNDPEDPDVFQIDVIRVPEDSYNFSFNYFSYNDLGNFIGRIAHKFGLKFGHRGLFYPLHWKDSDGSDVFLGDILLTNNFFAALSALGFNSKQRRKFEDGFDTMEDVYQFVYDNPFVYNDMFDLREVSHVARIRDRKRKSYSGLLEWMAKAPKKENMFYSDKTMYLPVIAEYWPHFAEEMKARISKHLLEKELRGRWNGKMVQLITSDVHGKDIGVFLKQHRPDDLVLLKKSHDSIMNYMAEKILEFKNGL